MDGETAHATPSWATPRQALHIAVHRPHLKRTLLTALVVGTVLFCINQLNVVLQHGVTTGIVIKTCLTYLVPFWVANIGLLYGTRQPARHTPKPKKPS